jgi:hypothetical protein
MIVMSSIVMVRTVFLIFKLGYDYDEDPKWKNTLLKKCIIANNSYFYMRVSNATECGGIVKWYDSHNWEFFTETDGQIVLFLRMIE